MKPVIGLIPLYDDERQSYWMLPGYMKAIEACGGVPIMLPLTTDKSELDVVYDLCDGILFTGGHDISPELYLENDMKKDKMTSEDKLESIKMSNPKEDRLYPSLCGIICKARDEMEAYILDKALSEDKPLLGICRGIQFINVFLGGSLYQDLPTEYKSDIDHHMTPPYDRGVHKVNVLDGTILSDIIGAGEISVNSYHHQAIKELSSEVDKLAISEDGIVEAIAVKNHRFAIGVQWHPEFSYQNSEENKKLIDAFVREC